MKTLPLAVNDGGFLPYVTGTFRGNYDITFEAREKALWSKLLPNSTQDMHTRSGYTIITVEDPRDGTIPRFHDDVEFCANLGHVTVEVVSRRDTRLPAFESVIHATSRSIAIRNPRN